MLSQNWGCRQADSPERSVHITGGVHREGAGPVTGGIESPKLDFLSWDSATSQGSFQMLHRPRVEAELKTVGLSSAFC